MSKLNWGKRAYAAFLLCVTTAITLPAQTFITLHSFEYTDGDYPAAALAQATNGNLYGTTFEGGANANAACYASGCGTVFKTTPSGTLATVYNFCSQSGCADGANPRAALVQATNGNFYGTTEVGGVYGYGTVFKITPSGTLTTVYSFGSQTGDGAEPFAGLAQASDGNFYGTTSYGGTSTVCSLGCGTVLSLSVGLGPFVETQPTSGKVGAAVKILGDQPHRRDQRHVSRQT